MTGRSPRTDLGILPKRTLFEMRCEMADLVTQAPGDPEAAHGRADEILIEALRYFASLLPPRDPTLWPVETDDLIASFNAVEKWYA